MGRTIAETLIEQGEVDGILRGKRQMLLMMLDYRFGSDVMPALTEAVVKTVDHGKLDEWVAGSSTQKPRKT